MPIIQEYPEPVNTKLRPVCVKYASIFCTKQSIRIRAHKPHAEGDDARRLHAVKANGIALLIAVRRQHRAVAEHRVPHPVADGKCRSLLLRRKPCKACGNSAFGLADQSRARFLGVGQHIAADIQQKARGIARRAVKIPPTKARRRSSSIPGSVRTLREGKTPSFMPQRNT